jgi:dTDP-4-dehydrorhamnose reductase
MNSLLDCAALARAFGYSMPDWRTDVVAFVRRLTAAGLTPG